MHITNLLSIGIVMFAVCLLLETSPHWLKLTYHNWFRKACPLVTCSSDKEERQTISIARLLRLPGDNAIISMQIAESPSLVCYILISPASKPFYIS